MGRFKAPVDENDIGYYTFRIFGKFDAFVLPAMPCSIGRFECRANEGSCLALGEASLENRDL
jgi:hypothetical protein